MNELLKPSNHALLSSLQLEVDRVFVAINYSIKSWSILDSRGCFGIVLTSRFLKLTLVSQFHQDLVEKNCCCKLISYYCILTVTIKENVKTRYKGQHAPSIPRICPKYASCITSQYGQCHFFGARNRICSNCLQELFQRGNS